MALLVQLLATRPVLRHVGVTGALLVLPLGLGLGEIGLLVLPGLAFGTLLKAGDESLRFSVHDAASQLVFLPVPSSARARLRAEIDHRWRPAAQLAVGGALVAYRAGWGAAVRPLAAVVLIGVVAWVATGLRLRAAYRRSLSETLRSRPDAFDGLDPAEVPAEEWAGLRAALAGDPEERLAALDLAAPLAPALVDAVAPSLPHPSVEVRRAASRVLATTPFDGWATLPADPDPEVAAIHLAARAGRGDPAARPLLVARLGTADPPTARWLLRGCWTGTEDLLAEALDRPDAPAPAILQRLGEIATPAARVPLLARLDDPRLGEAAARALARTTRGAALTEDEHARVDERLRVELGGAFEALAAADAMGKAESALAPDGTREANPFAPDEVIGALGLLSKALRERQERHRARVLWLLAARFPGAGLDRIRANLAEAAPTRRANAVELLDSTLAGDLRRLVVALVDDTPRPDKLRTAGAVWSLPRRSREAWLEALVADPSPSLAACAAWLVDVLRRPHPPPPGHRPMTAIEKLMLLRGVDLFAAVDGEGLAAIARVTTEAEVAPGEVLVREGEHGDALYVVVRGRARLTRGERVIGEVGERAVLGEVALLDPGPRTATVRALDALGVLRIDRDAFVEVLAAWPEVATAVLRMLARRTREALAG